VREQDLAVEDPVAKSTGFPFDCAQGGEPVEPRVKPGMTITPLDYDNRYKYS
jgi:hypothetical protein